MEYETYDSGYAEWQASDIELFLSEDENFSVGVWKAKAGQEVMDSPYPYNTWMLIKEGEIETINSSVISSFGSPGIICNCRRIE